MQFFNLNHSFIQNISQFIIDNNYSDISNDSWCPKIQIMSTVRFSLISASSAIAVVGVVANLFIIWIFLRLIKYEESGLRLYATALAFCDICFCADFLLLFQLDAMAVYLKLELFQCIVNNSMHFGFVYSKIIQLCIPYFIISATSERLAITSRFHDSSCVAIMSTNFVRITVICFVFGASVGLKWPNVWAYSMTFFPNCPGYFVSYQFEATEWLYNNQKTYKLIEFYIGTALQLFIPFTLLICLNIGIIYSIQSHKIPSPPCRVRTTILEMNAEIMKRNHKVVISTQYRPTDVFPVNTTVKNYGKLGVAKAKLRRALTARSMNRIKKEVTTTLIVLVSTYLLCNTPHIILTTLEQFDAAILFNDDLTESDFYFLFGDAVSVLFMYQSALRFLIYSACDPAICIQLRSILHL